MASIALSSTWQTADDWPGGLTTFFLRLTGTGSIEYRFSALQPSSNAAGIPIDAGNHFLSTVFQGNVPWFRVTTGSATLYYENDTGLPFETDVVGHAFDDGTTDDFVQTSDVYVGFNDTAAETEFAGYLITPAAGLSAIAGVYKSSLVLSTLSQVSSRTLRVYGLEYASSQASSVTSLTALQGLTKTAAYADATSNAGASFLAWDITTIIEELQGVGSWSTSSPIQLYIEDTGAAATGLDKRILFDFGNTTTSRIAILMDDGSELGTGVGEIP